jgi:predicted N-acyltransferase
MAERVRIETDMLRLPDAAWRQLHLDHPGLRLEALQSHAATDRTGTPLRVFLLEDDAGIVAAAVCRVAAAGRPTSATHLLYGRLAAPLSRVGLLRRPVLECRTPSTSAGGWVWRPDDVVSRRRAMRQLLDAMEHNARQNGMDLACIAVLASDTPQREELLERGYLHASTGAVAHLDVHWQDFDGYVRWLRGRSKNAATNARKEMSRNRQSGVTLRRIEPDRAAIEDLHRLLTAHHLDRNGWSPSMGTEFLQELARRLEDDLLMFAAERDGRRIAMMGGIRAGTTLCASWFGIELQDRENDFTYPCLTYYHVAGMAASMGLERILYGTAALAAKRARGCTITDSEIYYRPHGGWLKWFGRPYFSLHRRWKARRAA